MDTGDTQVEVEVVEVPEQRRFEARARGGLLVALADYERTGRSVAFTHTEVVAGPAGHGIASQLIEGALDQVRASGRTVIAYCPFVRAWLARHPRYDDLVARPRAAS